MFQRILTVVLGALVGAVVVAAGVLAVAVAITYPRLPSLDVLTDYRPKIPLRVYTADGDLIGEFGEERRFFTRIYDVPPLMKDALLSAEDERFYQHGGVDYIGVLRAAIGNVLSGHTRSGASTITMQVAKNFFLSSERTFTRKFNEALLAFKIEHTLTKDQILELYFNQIYLGQRSYGFQAASYAYYGKPLKEISIAQMAMLAGLPKAPSSYNPVVNPQRARLRQLYVLRRMKELGYINAVQYEEAVKAPLNLATKSEDGMTVQAQYVAEMVRQAMYNKYKDAAYTDGFKVYTTINSQDQRWAFDSLRAGLMDFDQRLGYRGPESYIDLNSLDGDDRDEALDEALSQFKDSGNLQPGVVLSDSASQVKVYLRGGQVAIVKDEGLHFARRALSDRLPVEQRIRPGAVVRIYPNPKGYWEIRQMPEVEGAFVAMDPYTGAVRALVGGFDFNRSNFNHVTQAWRQPGSTFKPFVYSAGISRGLTPSTLINDAPLYIDPASNGGQPWNPKNDDNRYGGLMTMRRGLALSKNLVSIRVLQAAGVDYTQQYAEKFGFSPKHNPAYLTMALGAGLVTPMQMAEAYSIFDNGGYRTRAYFISRIEDMNGRVIAKTEPQAVGKGAPQVIDPRNAFIMTSMLKDVVRYGTATRAMSLGRQDLAGKTGTTNDFRDAWFAGYAPNLVAITWVGYDQNKSLGRYGYGGTAALPIWINFMRNALKNVPQVDQPVPAGIVVKPGLGLRGGDEYYLDEYQTTNPELKLNNSGSVPGSDSSSGDDASASVTDNLNQPPPQDAVENVKQLLF